MSCDLFDAVLYLHVMSLITSHQSCTMKCMVPFHHNVIIYHRSWSHDTTTSHMICHMITLLQELLDEHAQKLEKYKDCENVFDPSCFHWTPQDYPIYT